MVDDEMDAPEDKTRAVAGIFCNTFGELLQWIAWAHERNRPFHAGTFEGELGFRIDIVLDDGETCNGSEIVPL